jgi:DHA2 family multidrug resistance protein
LIDLTVFKSGKFIFAILLMLLFWGLKDSINLIYGYSASVLGWNSADVVNAGMFNIAGVVTATFMAVKVIQTNKQNLPKLLLAGFGLLFVYHVWVYANLTPDLSFAQLGIPIFLHGFACGLLFVPVSIFCMASVPQSTGMTGIVILAYARFIATLNSIAGFYTLQLYYNQQFKEGFLGKLFPENGIVLQRQELYKGVFTSKGFAPGEAAGISNMLLAKASGIQSQLLTIRAVFFIAMIIVVVVVVVLLVFAVINKIKAIRTSE